MKTPGRAGSKPEFHHQPVCRGLADAAVCLPGRKYLPATRAKNQLQKNVSRRNLMSKSIRPVSAMLGVLAGVSLNSAVAHEMGKANESYVGDSGGHLLTDGSGNCVQTGSWSKDQDLVDCGAVPAPQAAAPEPAARTSAAPAPALVVPVAVSQSVALSSGALFDLNSDTLKDAGKQELDLLAARIKGMEEIQSVKIVGHSDSSGAESYNQQLSQRRANSVKNYLLDQGVSPTVMSTLGMGESQPIADNATREGRAKNRRVEITIEGMAAR
jgi:OOP family OmpA-OmpF porin